MSDLIDRQAVLDLFQNNVSTLHNYARVWEAVEEMPSVTPTERTGHREYNDIYDHYLCSNCKTIVADYDNYCPNCGADMRGDTE